MGMKTIMICIKRRSPHQPSCAGRGSEALALALERRIAEQALPLKVHRFPCLGLCEAGPNMKVVGGDLFHYVQEADFNMVLQSALEL